MHYYIKIIIVACGLYLSSAIAEEAPSFQNNVLKIPRVDTPEQVGRYQNAEFILAADGRWDLVKAAEATQAYVDQIEIKVLESFPVQIHVLVSGNLPTPCYQLGPMNVRYADNRFEIAVNVTQLQTFAACAQVLHPFQTTIALDVYGLPEGTYNVIVNDKSGSFVLHKDNQ